MRWQVESLSEILHKDMTFQGKLASRREGRRASTIKEDAGKHWRLGSWRCKAHAHASNGHGTNGHAAEPSAPTDSFKLNLFPDTSMDSAGGGDGGVGVGTPMIMIDGGGSKALQASNRNLMGIMDELRQPADSQLGGDVDDLLGLMDAADN